MLRVSARANRRDFLVDMRAFTATALMLASAAALAQAGGDMTPLSGPGAGFVALDRNRDGSISRVEALASLEIRKRFASFDVNKDGYLSDVEYAAAVDDNRKRILHDSAITARVKAALLAERGIPSLSISVETYESRVQLSGLVSVPDIASRAGRVTAGVNGVRTVHNDLWVK
ncbi:MAG: BON domain-containing protein [Betaproteobacteria bacterium]|nr:MAG: BON domain-containing protein [Betaproteobacteria bacterium]